jgi:excisionase family DNA binding protein
MKVSKKTPAVVQDWDAVPVICDLPFAARIVGLSPEYLKQLAAKGTFPAFKLGGLWRVRKSALMEYCGERRTEGLQ